MIVVPRHGDLWRGYRGRPGPAWLKLERPGHDEYTMRLCWDAPTEIDLLRLRPTWTQAKADAALNGFDQHERQWGPGDVELVHVKGNRIKLRVKASLFEYIEHVYRWEWDKVRRHTHWYDKDELHWRPFGECILVLADYHHTFYPPDHRQYKERARKGPHAIYPVLPMTQEEWGYLKIVSKRRGHVGWERELMG